MIATIPPQDPAPLLNHPVVRLAERGELFQAADLLDRKKHNSVARFYGKTALHQARGVTGRGALRMIARGIQDWG